jgi:hypothetical protein
LRRAGASKEDGLQFPRSIIQVPGHDQFVIADMGAWVPFKGRLLLFDPALAPGHRTKVLLESVDYPFGLAIGLDGKVYASTAETIFRFDPLARDPKETVETIVQGLPARGITLPDGSKVAESVHPIKQFAFDKTGRLYVNIGAPTDACVTKAPITKPCAAGEGPAPLAAIMGLYATGWRRFSGAEARRSQPLARDIRQRAAQLDGACGPSSVSSGRICISPGRKCAGSA